MNDKRLLIIAVLLVFTITIAAVPRVARAGSDDFTEPLIIGAVVVGAIAVIGTVVAVIAVLAAGDDPHFLTMPPKDAEMGAARGLRFAPQCAPPADSAGSTALVCW